MANGENIFREMTELLKDPNTQLTIQQRDNFLIASIIDLNKKLDKLLELDTRVKELERTSIVMFASKHPKAFTVIVTLVVFLLSLWSVIGRPLLIAIGINPDVLIP